MDEEGVSGSAAPSDPGYHDDDELAAVLAAQLEQIIETGSVPQQENPPASAPAAPQPTSPRPTAATPPRVARRSGAEPPPLTGPLKPPSHRADRATTATGPSAAVEPEHRPEHRAEREQARAAHRSDALRTSERAASAVTTPAGDAPTEARAAPAGTTAHTPPELDPAPTPAAPPAPPSSAAPATVPAPASHETHDRGSVPLVTDSVALDTGGLPLDTDSLPLSRRARRAAERAHAPGQPPPTTADRPRTEPVDVPGAAVPSAPRASHSAAAASAGPAVPDPARPLREPADSAEDRDAAAPPRRRSYRPPPEAAAERESGREPEPEQRSTPGRSAARHHHAPSHAASVELAQSDADAEPVPVAHPSEPAHGAAERSDSDGWSRALRIIGAPTGEVEPVEDPGGPEPSPVHAGTWFEEPLPTTGTVLLSGSPTGPVPVADPDDEGEVDEVESEYGALAADTASVGVLPPMVEEAGRHVVPPISRGSLDRERLPEAALDEPPHRGLRSGLLAPLATWAGVAGSPLAIVAGFALGGGPVSVLGVAIGLVLALPAVLRLSALGARSGRDAVGIARGSLGEIAGTAAGIVLLVGRIGIAALGLLEVAELATSFAGRTGLGGALPASGAAILAVLVAGLLALAIGAGPGRIVGVVLGAAGAVALFASASLLVVLSGSGGGAVPGAASPVPAAVAGFALVGLVVASGAAEVSRRPLAGSPWRLGVLGTGLGAAAAAVVLALGGAAAGAGAADGGATDAFVGDIVDATSVALVAPIAVLLLLSSLALVATAARGAGTAAVSLLERGRSTGLGTAAAALVAIALALAALAGGLGASAALFSFGPLLAVPLTAVLAALTAAPARHRGAGRTPLVVLGVTVLLGWLLVDHLLAPGERSPLLDLLGVPGSSPWRSVPAIGLLVAATGGAVAGGLARLRPRAAPDDTTERLPAMQAAAPE